MMIKDRQILMFEVGDLDTFNYVGPFRAIRDFDQSHVTKLFLQAFYFVHDETQKPKPIHFTSWLLNNGWVENVDCVSWYLGDEELKPIEWSE